MTTKENPLDRILDPKFYLESFCKIKGKTPGLMPFILNEAQKDLFNALNAYSRIIILKARQMGFSTAVTGYLYHKTITTPGTNTALIGYNSDLTAELLDKVKTFYRTTPESIRPQIQYNSKYEISFPAIDSKILVLPSSENVGRGYTLHNVLLTELAFWEKAEEKMLAIENAVPQDGKIVIESTPNAVGNLYHRMWMAENDYCKKEFGWWWGYTEEEVEIIRRRINNPMRFAQEYGLEFLSSGRPVFSSDLIKKLRKGILKVGDKAKFSINSSDPLNKVEGESIVTQDPDGLIMYFQPRPDAQYIAGVDVSEGVTGGDYSVFVVWDRETGDEVAWWRGYLPPDRFGIQLNKWGRTYNNALMVVEINNHGLTTVTALKNLMYPQLYFRPANFDHMGSSPSDRLGWKTTKVTRPLMIDDFREALQEGSIKIHSEKTLDEMLTFVFDDGGNMVSQSSFHDDCFVKGTKILTNKGQVNIEDIKIGDIVLTREGFKPVLFTRNKLKNVVKNIGLCGTANHPVILANGKQKDLELVTKDDKLHIWNQSKQKIEKLSFMEAKNIIDIQNLKTDIYEITSGDTISGKNHHFPYIGKYGLTILVKLVMDTIYIIKMKILSIMNFLISSAYHLKSINQVTSTREIKLVKKYVLSVIKSFFAGVLEKPFFVVRNVHTKHGILKGEKVENLKTKEEMVYNLQINGCNEYFANNILVHNCIFASAIGFQGFKIMYSGKLDQINYEDHLPASSSY